MVTVLPPLVGSPPRMRGKGLLIKAIAQAVGITPAHAGKRRKVKCLRLPNRDHPRACGEKAARTDGFRVVQGSPPRMRGKVIKITICNTITRITPAHAGKRNTLLCAKMLLGDHPRACGEKSTVVQSLLDNPGSPPRMRGKAATNTANAGLIRITPAHAGKSATGVTGALG